uniref:ATP synthase complex subunit 8 n=1 Tax=Olidiana tongmaiensis TaxID=2501809 RepID=A0A898PA47_9HEMI|nr:ATP synthase F0 subunit 8 [Olidiana tongmaiensis]QSJ61397.1 ATP synthase F0 subunit 8 [Olidiana tongmaiensis]
MPQMSPSWWMMIIISTTIMLMYMISIKFHNINYKMTLKEKNMKYKNWKW